LSKKAFFIEKGYHNDSYALILNDSSRYMKSGLNAWMLEL
jgi:hypothetical protein